jgi:Rrf2 family transcriptional regulator, iron-sulfur cluster assembly transcription factor
MRIPPRTRYAVSAMLHLAMHHDLGPVPMAEISICQGISASYVEQIFARLRSSHLIQGYPGPGGGYRLAIAPEACSIKTILDAMHDARPADPAAPRQSVSALEEAVWAELSARMDAWLDSVTLADLVDRPEIRASVLRQYDRQHDRQPWRCDVCGALSQRRCGAAALNA